MKANLDKLFNLLVVVVVTMAILSLGCDDVPRLPTQSAIVASEYSVTNAGRRGYDWSVTDNGFEIAVPASDEIRVNWDNVLRNLAGAQKPDSYVHPRPDGMEDDVYRRISQLTQNYTAAQLQPVYKMAFQPSGPGHFCLDASGKWLAYLDTQLVIWDIENSEIVQKSNLAAEPVALHWDRDTEFLILQYSKTIQRWSRTSESVVQSWNAGSDDEVAGLDSATQTGRHAVTTQQGKLVVLDQELELEFSFAKPVDSTRVAISSDGKSVLALSQGAYVCWDLEQLKIRKLESVDASAPQCIPIAMQEYYCWISPDTFVGFALAADSPTAEKRRINFGPRQNIIRRCWNGTDEWLTNLVTRSESDGLRYYIQDYHLPSSHFSMEYSLGSQPILEFECDATGDRVVVRDSDGLRVHCRKSWLYTRPDWTADYLVSLVPLGRFDQIELALENIRNLPLWKRDSGEYYFHILTQRLARNWADFETQAEDTDASRTAIQQFERWRSQGSELSKVVSAVRLSILADDVRNKISAGQIEDGWTVYNQRLKQFENEIEPLTQNPQPTGETLLAAIRAQFNNDRDGKSVQPIANRAFELYPYFYEPQRYGCNFNLPAWGGSSGGIAAIVAAYAQKLPVPFGDLMHVEVARGLVSMYKEDVSLLTASNTGLTLKEMLRRMENLTSTKLLRIQTVELFMKLALDDFPEVADRLADYHVANFGCTFSNTPQVLELVERAHARAFATVE